MNGGALVPSAVGGTRTPNLQVRSLLLYPIELRPHNVTHEATAYDTAALCVSLRLVRDASEREGFEPSIRVYTPYNGLANRRLQPLGHLSAATFPTIPHSHKPHLGLLAWRTRSFKRRFFDKFSCDGLRAYYGRSGGHARLCSTA